MGTVIKLAVLGLAFVALFTTIPQNYPSFGHEAFNVGQIITGANFAVTWTMLAILAIVGGGAVYLRAK